MPPDPSRAHRALDRIPTRNTRGQQQNLPSPGSYSPTSSEADALEASFYDYDDLALPPVASSADYNYIKDDDDDEEDDNTLVDAPTSLKDRLRFAWRMLHLRTPPAAGTTLRADQKCASSMPTGAGRRPLYRPVGVAQGRHLL